MEEDTDDWTCHVDGCDEEPAHFIYAVYLPGSTSQTRVFRRCCTEDFTEVLHAMARREWKDDRRLARIENVIGVVGCPATFCNERMVATDLDGHIEEHHDVKTLSDDAYQQLQEVRQRV